MKEVNLPVKCSSCGESATIRVNLWTGDYKQLPPAAEKPARFADLSRVVDAYKSLKGFDRFPTWDKMYRARAMAAAKKLLRFFARLTDPAGVSMECMQEKAGEFKKANLHWSLETIVAHAPDWLARKQNG